jgi:hypothetical protein
VKVTLRLASLLFASGVVLDNGHTNIELLKGEVRLDWPLASFKRQ